MSYDDAKANAPDPGTVGEERDDSKDGLCDVCFEEEATTFFDRGADFQYWTGQPRRQPVCEACKSKLENRAPQEPDGEAFRGGEAAAY